MTDHHDDIDAWLERDVTPLYPPSGSFERISRVARKRKRRQALLAVACCAVLAGAAASAPQLASALSHGGSQHPPSLADNSKAPAVTPTSGRGSSGSPGRTAVTKSVPIQKAQRTSLSRSWTKPPPNFRPTSVTAVGGGPNGLIGAVIGQAGTPGHCATKDCTSLATTLNYGASWYGLSAPVAPGPSGSAGVSELRFANTSDGWAFGPALYATSDGGPSWTEVPTDGLRVTDLETKGQRAFMIAASCTGDTTDFAGDCTSFSVYTIVAGSTSWTPVTVPAAYQHMKTQAPSSASLVISGGKTVYLLTPTGALLSGPVSGGAWHEAGPLPAGCLPGPAQSDGQPADAQLAAGNTLLLACDTMSASGTEQTVLYSSADGAVWTKVGVVPHLGLATSLASASSGQMVLATTAGLYYSAQGVTWRQATAAAPGGFSYVGMTNQYQGVAVPEDASLGEIYVTSDGGEAWVPSPIKL